VPVEFADGSFVETHVHAGKFDACGEFADGGLPGPAPFL
jgi:hypothetical protein